MSPETVSPLTEVLRGDICPSWCAGEDFEHPGDRRPKTPLADRGLVHQSPVFATWLTDNEGNPLPPAYASVQLIAFRHDHGTDWPDHILIDGGPSSLPRFTVTAVDARKLAAALVRAADVLEAKP